MNNKVIKLNFSDMWRGFDVNNNFITDVIREYFVGFEISDNPEFLFFSCCGTEHYRYDKCVKIFIPGEAVVPDFNICDYAIAYPYIEYGDKYIRHPAWFWHEPPSEITMSDEELINRKFCNFVYTNETRGTAVEFRKAFAKKLMQYKPVDCPGKVLNNMPPGSIEPRRGNYRDGKIDFIRNYKFTIAFENCRMPGYCTEKIEDPYIAHSVPIYWGDTRVEEIYNIDSMICVNGYEDDLDSIIDKIVYFDTHDDDYLRMLKLNPTVEDPMAGIQRYKKFLINILDGNTEIIERDPMGFGKVMTIPDYRAKDLVYMLGNKLINKLRKQ